MKSENSFGTSVEDCPPRFARMTFRNYETAEMTCQNNIANKVSVCYLKKIQKRDYLPFLKIFEYRGQRVFARNDLRREIARLSVVLTLQPASGNFSEVVCFSSTTIQKSESIPLQYCVTILGVLILFGMLYMPIERTTSDFANSGKASVFQHQQHGRRWSSTLSLPTRLQCVPR